MRRIHFDELTSTNDEAMHGEYPHNTIITADCQSAGRGQRGNRWESRKGENLTFSLVIEPCHIPVTEQYRISMMAALAASDAVRLFGLECRIKWSNDLYVGDNKIGGILIEHSLMGEMLTKSVVGIGVNVLQTDFPDQLPNPTSIRREGIDGCTPDKLLEILVEKFEIRYRQSVQTLHQDYMDRLWRRNEMRSYMDKDGEFIAKIVEVDALTGMLTLLTESGQRRSYWFKEVEFLL